MIHLIGRVSRSLRQRGVKRTVESGVSIAEHLLFDLRHGTDTFRRVDLRELSLPGGDRKEAHPYHPTRGRAFTSIMRRLSFPSDSVFVDFGSGKGYPLLLASQLGFKRVVGVEYSAKLCRIAEQNIKRWSRRHRDAQIQIHCCDAGDYPVQDDDNVFFMFNPFGSAVMQRLVANIAASLSRCPRQAWIIYADPTRRAEIEQVLTVHQLLSHSYGGFDFVVWTTDAKTLSPASRRNAGDKGTVRRSVSERLA